MTEFAVVWAWQIRYFSSPGHPVAGKEKRKIYKTEIWSE